MNQPIQCPKCDKPLEQVGQFWICREHGQVSLESPFTPLRLFLSYGHDSNEELASLISNDLKKRGHEVWIDKSEIKGGDDWRRKITDGIMDSHRVLSLLSKYSTRDPGVCLDEIGIAIGTMGGNIQTILVEGENEVKPPPTISYIQWLDMHEWKEKREEGAELWNVWYQAKITEIISVVESDESRHFAGEIKTLEEYLKPISSKSRISQLLKKRFVGRTWVIKAIEEWRNSTDRSSRLFWIMGAPGVGKSAFVAHLTHYGRDKVIAVQFCEYDKPDHRNAHRIVRTLAFQMATRLPDYRKILLTLPEINDLDNKNPSELFDYLLANPLRHAIDGGRERYLVVIDALDEAGGNGRNELVEMLAMNAQRLPDWIGIIVTSRPESNVIAPLQGLKPFPLDTAIESNSSDIRDYLRHELALHLQNRRDTDRVVDQILEKSEGVFLYVERFCDDVQYGHLSLDHPEQFPQGLGGIFFQYFQRQFPDIEKFRKEIRPALRAILAAREPLPVEILQRLFNWQDEELRDFTRTLGSLFLVLTDTGQEVIKAYHKSLTDWLKDEAKAGVYFVSVMEGHRILADLCWNEYSRGANTMTQYSVRHVRAHLARIGETDRKALIESDPTYITLLCRISSNEQVIRVWISSTFRDMQNERDYLVKYVFPQIREFCDLSNIVFTEIDLRWGITDEQAAEGNVLPICLADIDQCRPYFIGILGERYGWILDSIPESVLTLFPWLDQFKGRSILEIEAFYGALRQNIGPSEALFYFRDPVVSAEIEAQHNLSGRFDNKDSKALLQGLKQRIRLAASEGRCALHENFQTSVELGEWVHRDLIKKINSQQVINMMDLESARHLAFARRQVRTYLPIQCYFEQLDAALLNQGKPLMVYGEVGIGKSALLANWSLQHQESHPIEIIHLHFAGSVPDSTDEFQAIRRIMDNLKRSCYLSMEISDAKDKIKRGFHNFLDAASEGERLILVIDGLEAFDSANNPGNFEWLPDVSPNNCQIIVSTSSPSIVESFRARKWSELMVHPLTFTERKDLITRVLSYNYRQLSHDQVDMIAAFPQTCNPLYLCSLLEELRLYGDRDTLMAETARYLAMETIPDLFERILERYEQDFGSDLVRYGLSFVWKSPQGICEKELLDLLENAGVPNSTASWKSFERASRSIYLETGGRFRICHPFWRKAIENRYFQNTTHDEKLGTSNQM